MDILFHSKFLQHNRDSFAEGQYRLADFVHRVGETDSNGEEFITLVHSVDYRERIRQACMHHQVLAEVNLTPDSYGAACSAIGLTVLASETDGFAVVRPPGHHAKRERADGFCLFNNMAIASQKLVNEGKRVFVLDIDGHHGDGTQEIFYRSDQVLYCSIHQQYAYPGTGRSNEEGEGPGEGYTMNFPLTEGSGDREFLGAVDTAIRRAEAFGPDAVGVSAGFDGYILDRLLGLNYTLEGYYHCGKKLGHSFDHIFGVLEGGYHQDIYNCTEAFIRGVNGS